jgi:hypothetical protein
MKQTKTLIRIALLTIFSIQTHAVIQQHSNPNQSQPVVINGTPPSTLINDDGTAENFIGDSGQFIWLNRFTPTALEFPFQLEEVSAVFGNTSVSVGDSIRILVYEDTDGDGDPGTGAVLLADYSETIQFNDTATFNIYNLPAPVMLNGPGDVLIGIVNSYGSEGFADFPAALDQTATSGRSWAATYLAGDVPVNPTLPADEQWGTIDSFGFPGNWIIRGAGSRIALPIPTLNYIGLLILISLIVTLFLYRNKLKLIQS